MLKIIHLPKIKVDTIHNFVGRRYIDDTLIIEYDDDDIDYLLDGKSHTLTLNISEDIQRRLPPTESVTVYNIVVLTNLDKKLKCYIDTYHLNLYNAIHYINITDYKNKLLLELEYNQAMERIMKL